MQKRFDKYIDKVERFYSKNKEHYHTIHHIHRMFEVYEKFEEQFDEEFEYDKDDLFWSIAFHDAYYLVGYELFIFFLRLVAGLLGSLDFETHGKFLFVDLLLKSVINLSLQGLSMCHVLIANQPCQGSDDSLG